MGFFDKMKQMANAVTGGGAKVSLQIGDAALGQAIPVTVTAMVSDGADLSISSVYILLRGLETAKVDPNKLRGVGGVPTNMDAGKMASSAMGQGRLLDYKVESFSGRIDIAGAQKLEAGQTYTFEGEIRLPGGAQGTFIGKHISHQIQAQAGLDAPGNDPDSGWIDMVVRNG